MQPNTGQFQSPDNSVAIVKDTVSKTTGKSHCLKQRKELTFYRGMTKVDYDGLWEECPNLISPVQSKVGRKEYRTYDLA